ncbi:MAG TPA: hypothetical protein VMS55_25140 [Myxococcota bacterium]|nr:hypothetical protein [Myxococcota bacterium]
MLHSKLLTGVATAPLAVALAALAPTALAHTTIAAQAIEGVRSDNALRIGHGCEEDLRAVIAQSVVFPTDAPDLATSDPSVTVSDLSTVIEQGGIAGLASLVQDRSIFFSQDVKRDANGNVIGFIGKDGFLKTGLHGHVPFEFSSPNFVATSCAKSLIIQVAIADICGLRKPTIQPEKVNLWIPDNGSQLATLGAANDIDGIGAPANLVVNRNLLSNPLDPACGAGYSVTVTPSAAQVDRDLPIPGFWAPR